MTNSKFSEQGYSFFTDSRNHKGFILFLRTAAAVTFITILFQIIDIGKVKAELTQANWTWIIYALSFTCLSPLLAAIRLKYFFATTGVLLSFKLCLKVSLLGLSLNLLIPARGGDLAKLAFLRNDLPNLPLQTLISTALLERGFDVLALGVIGLTSALIIQSTQAAIFAGVFATIAAIILAVLPLAEFWPLVGKKISPVAQVISNAYKNKKKLLLAFLTAVSFWILVSSILGCLLKAFDPNITFAHALAVTPPSIFVGLVPVSLWGVGTRDGALAYFLEGITVAEIAISAGFLYTALVYWFLGIIGTPFLLFARRNQKGSTPIPN
jgi:uncharacterized membrane protein YbhN (UPF0104 family)